ncbi:MAG TPA: hypothetical protein VFH47_00530, partial [Candidatus Thermoplasmatota archaeon]|nr:hypothetical protein [Candidatus Thermoplasmatota archaeon]
SWAVLKTGTRFAVAWMGDAAAPGTLHYRIGDGAEMVASDASRLGHLIVVELPESAVGQRLEFFIRSNVEGKPQESDRHAVHIGNGPTSWDGERYTINFLVLANEKPHRGNLEEGIRRSARLLHDASDGWISFGRAIIVYDNDAQQDGGRVRGCQAEPQSKCVQFYDVVFTADEQPGAAGTAQLDGLMSPTGKIVMNQAVEAPGPDSPVLDEQDIEEVKSVLTHEFGHYAFGMMDFYPGGGIPYAGVLVNAAIPVPDCWVPETEVTIMAGSRLPTEFDDEFNRCPPSNEEWHKTKGGYRPSWTQMRAPHRFPLVPDRQTLPDPGPIGDGGFQLNAYPFGEEVLMSGTPV